MKLYINHIKTLNKKKSVQLFSMLKKHKDNKLGRSGHTMVKNSVRNARLLLKLMNSSVYIYSNKRNSIEGIEASSFCGGPIGLRLEEYKQVKLELREKIKQAREKNRELKSVEREFGGIGYETVGGVFLKTQTIMALAGSAQIERMNKPKKPTSDDKRTFVGVELELISKLSREDMKKALAKQLLGGYVYLKDDSSISKENEGDRTHEITVLAPQDTIKDVIRRLCSVLNDDAVGSYVNNSCGLHVHLDARHRDKAVMFNNLVKALPMLKNLVPRTRTMSEQGNRYCRMNETASYEDSSTDRYFAINGRNAFDKYRTIEVRMHSGSTNAAKINNWIDILCSLVDAPLIATPIHNVYEYQSVIECSSKLSEFIRARTELFCGKMAAAVDTRADHYFYSQGDLYV